MRRAWQNANTIACLPSLHLLHLFTLSYNVLMDSSGLALEILCPMDRIYDQSMDNMNDFISNNATASWITSSSDHG